MCAESWKTARSKYNWTVNLRDFWYRVNYQGYFNEEINKENTEAFEEKFRIAIDSSRGFAYTLTKSPSIALSIEESLSTFQIFLKI